LGVVRQMQEIPPGWHYREDAAVAVLWSGILFGILRTQGSNFLLFFFFFFFFFFLCLFLFPIGLSHPTYSGIVWLRPYS
jgi:hypothetical protein